MYYNSNHTAVSNILVQRIREEAWYQRAFLQSRISPLEFSNIDVISRKIRRLKESMHQLVTPLATYHSRKDQSIAYPEQGKHQNVRKPDGESHMIKIMFVVPIGWLHR